MSSGASLNHIFRTVWNQALGAMVAIAETGTSVGRGAARRSKSAELHRPPEVGVGLLALSIAVAWSASSLTVLANPTGGVAVVGQVATVSTGNNLQVTTQNGAGANFSAINWQSFSIPAGSSTYFQQPNANSTSINRVVTNTPSQLFGTLSSNGSLVLVNQSGIAVGAGAVVDTAGFTASSLAMSDQDAMAGRLRFGNGSIGTADVSVNGTVLARSGDVVLLGPNVQTGQDALIQAPNGNAILVAGRQIDITERGLEGIRLQVQAPSNSVVNLGSLKGDAVGLFAGTLKHSGLIQATAVSDSGGRVILKGQDLLNISGEVDAKQRGGMGGEVWASADKVLLQRTALLNVSGENGGGEVLVGGGWQGHDVRLSNSTQTVVTAGARLKADALVQGNGGTAVVWSDGGTRFAGAVSAHGGVSGGDGGHAEVSGKQFLDFQGSANLSSSKGKLGILLLDPATLTIQSTAPDINGDTIIGDDVTLAGLLSTDFGTSSSIVTSGQVGTLLNTANLSLAATGAVTVNAPITKTSGSATTLTLTSTSGSVSVNAAISGTSGSPLNVTLNGPTAVNIGGAIDTQGGAVSISATFGGNITQSGGAPISASGVSASAYGAITLADPANDIKAFSATSSMGGGIGFKTTGAVTLGSISSFSTLSVVANGAITQSAPISIGGTTLFDAGIGSIALTDASNAFSGAVSLGTLGSSNATLKNNGSINISAANIGGTLALYPLANGSSLSQTGAIAANTLDITMNPVGNGSVSLTNPGNTVNTLSVMNTGTGQINYFNNAALSLGPITAGGSLSIGTTSGTNISQSGGPITMSDPLSTASINAGSYGGYGSVVLMNPSNDFAIVNVVGTQVSLRDINALTVSGLYADSGASLIQSGGAITLTGSIRSNVTGDAVKFISGGTFNGAGGSFSLPLGARWLAYLGTPGADTFNTGSAPPSFKQYNAVNGSTVLGTGNAVLYSTAPVLSGSLTGAVSKIYDGGLSISPSGASVGGLSGALGLDDISTASASPTTANLSDPNVGTGKTVTVSGSVGGVIGGSSDLYFFSKPIYGYQFSASGNIGAVTPAQASVSLTGSRPYDGTDIVKASIFKLSGLANSETLTLSGFGTVADKNVGANKTVTLGSLALGDGTGLASNYTFTGGTQVAAITPALLGVIGGNRPYDGTSIINSGMLTLSGLVTGETLNLSGTGAVADKNAGSSKAVSLANVALVDGTGLASNYSIAGAATTVAITPKSVTPTSITAGNKVYDGNVIATVTGGQVSGLISGDVVTLSGSGAFSDKNVGIGKTVTLNALNLSGIDGGNYFLSGNTATASADITPKLLDVSGLTALSKEYDGKLTAVAGTGGVGFAGLVGNDSVVLSSAQGSFSSKDVGVGKPVVFSVFGLDGADGGNYKVGSSNSAKANITARPLSSWTGKGNSGLWSDPNNWDVIPDGANVLAVNVPAGQGVVTVDASAGAIFLQSLASGSGFAISGGSLQVGDSFTSTGYLQSGGSVTGSGAFKVNGSFNQSAGSITFGSVDVVQTSGDLNVRSITSPVVVLTATSGAIRQSDGGIQSGSLTTNSTAGTYLNAPGNQLLAFNATNKGTGNIELVNTGTLKLQGALAVGGSIKVINTGGISTTVLVSALDGSVSLTANSPLTIGELGIQAGGDISLIATNLTSAGNITLNGPIESVSGGVAVSAASNLTQNSSILAPLGVRAAAGGTMTFGPLATSGYQPVSYSVSGQPVSPPRSPASGTFATDQIISLMQTAPNLGGDASVNPIDTLLKLDKERDLSKELIVSEGQICRP